MMNRYYILPLANNHSAIWNLIVEEESSVRKNLQGNKMIVKLPLGDNANHGIFNGVQEYTHEEITDIVNSDPDWILDGNF